MTLHSEMQLALSTEREKELYSQIEELRSQIENLQDLDITIACLMEFLHRFMYAANSHIELEPFIEEGEELLRSIKE